MDGNIKYSKDGKVVFYDDTHSYLDVETKKRFKSVTQTIHHYANEFDPDGSITANFAKEHDLSVEEIEEYWRIENRISTAYGSKVHLAMEDYIIHGIFPKKEKYKWMVEQFSQIEFKGKLKAEALIYSKEHMIAGQVDVTENLGDGWISIWDFKTNKKLDKVSEYGQYMKHGLWHLSDCNFNHYQIQLSMYAYIYELKGMKIKDLNIIFINRDTKKLEIHTCKYLKKEIEYLMGERLNELKLVA